MGDSERIPSTIHVQSSDNSEFNATKDATLFKDATEREHASSLDKEISKHCYICNERAPVIHLEVNIAFILYTSNIS